MFSAICKLASQSTNWQIGQIGRLDGTYTCIPVKITPLQDFGPGKRCVGGGGGGGKGYSEPSLYCTAKFIVQHHCSAEPAALVWPARFHKRQLFRIVLKCQNLGENMTQQFCIFSLLSWFNSCDSWHISILWQDYFHVRKRP